MTPGAITLLFKEARYSFPPIKGKPADDDLLLIRETLLPILMEIPYDQLRGIHSLTAILWDTVTYATDHGGNAFKCKTQRCQLYQHNVVSAAPSNEVHIHVVSISKLYTDDTGHFPVRAWSGNQYVMIAYHADGNLILQQAFKTRSDKHCIAAYNTIMTRLAACSLAVDLQILDNETSAAYKHAITVT